MPSLPTDLLFFTAALTSAPDSVERVGDRILAAKGSLVMPFYASDRFFENGEYTRRTIPILFLSDTFFTVDSDMRTQN